MKRLINPQSTSSSLNTVRVIVVDAEVVVDVEAVEVVVDAEVVVAVVVVEAAVDGCRG